jgi:hypothetical protein
MALGRGMGGARASGLEPCYWGTDHMRGPRAVWWERGPRAGHGDPGRGKRLGLGKREGEKLWAFSFMFLFFSLSISFLPFLFKFDFSFEFKI